MSLPDYNVTERAKFPLDRISPHPTYGWRRFLWNNKIIIPMTLIGCYVYGSAQYKKRTLQRQREVQECEELLRFRFGPTYKYRFPNGRAHFPNGWSDLENLGYTKLVKSIEVLICNASPESSFSSRFGLDQAPKEPILDSLEMYRFVVLMAAHHPRFQLIGQYLHCDLPGDHLNQQILFQMHFIT